MPTFEVRTASCRYSSIVERGIAKRAADFLPSNAGKLFIVTSADIWRYHADSIGADLRERAALIFFPGGEPNKRLSCVELLADEMLSHGADRTSVVIAFGGGIVTDVSGFLAAIFMRGVPVLQIPTTLLAQVDAAIGGKTGVNLAGGKNLLGSFHQPLAVLIDPALIHTLPAREYRAGLYEVIKSAIIRDPSLFEMLEKQAEQVQAMEPSIVDQIIAASVRIKAEVVSQDERESDLRRILNFGHTVGHAIESETRYARFLHGEAVGWGMLAAIRLAELTGDLNAGDAERMRTLILKYGPLPPASGLDTKSLVARLASDKKTRHGTVHFILPVKIGAVEVVSGVDPSLVERAVSESLS